MATTRRDFLKYSLSSSSILAFGPPALTWARVDEKGHGHSDKRLVIIQLSGGNDGLNTLIPYRDEAYAEYRPTLKQREDRVLKIDDELAWHPALEPFDKLLNEGSLCAIQGVGYPNPDRSHFLSTTIWETGRREPHLHNGWGWVGQSLDQREQDAFSIYIGSGNYPVALRGKRSTSSSLESLDDFVVPSVSMSEPGSASSPSLEEIVARSLKSARDTAKRLEDIRDASDDSSGYPNTALAQRMKTAAQLIRNGDASSVYYVHQPGYDTHSAQAFSHDGLLRELGGAVSSFLADIAQAGLGDSTLVLITSEFGRRVRENGALGTDHGSAAPVFLAGSPVRSGLLGPKPDLRDLQDGDVKTSIDFRRVYATLIDQWLELDSVKVLGERYEPLALLRTS